MSCASFLSINRSLNENISMLNERLVNTTYRVPKKPGLKYFTMIPGITSLVCFHKWKGCYMIFICWSLREPLFWVVLSRSSSKLQRSYFHCEGMFTSPLFRPFLCRTMLCCSGILWQRLFHKITQQRSIVWHRIDINKGP